MSIEGTVNHGVYAVALLISLSLAKPAIAQTGTSRLTLQGSAEQSSAPIIRSALGRPCLDVEAAARAHVANPNLIDHVVSIKNNCPKLIKVKVCYFNSESCKAFDLLGYKTVDSVLGTMTGIKSFRYVINQK